MGSIPFGSAGDGQAKSPAIPDSFESRPPRAERREDATEALSPAIASALEEGFGTLSERLLLIREHSPRAQRYDLLSEVGKGAMGRVLRVWDRVLQRELALKLLHVARPERLAPGDEEAQAERANADRRTTRFIEEARITGQLDHPGIVPVHELAFDAQNQLYFAMPLVRGLTLSRIFELVRARERGWTLRRAMDVLHKVCLTVAFAHSKGVVHRDLKPDNIMVGPFGESYVMDWGLALIQGKNEHAAYLGTPGYMAPEQVSTPQLVGPAADVYALGAILYHLLKGSTPHQSTLDANATGYLDLVELMARPPRAISSEALNVPPELVAICQRAMQPELEERYASALELAAEIERWMEGRVVEAHDTDGLTRLKKWSLRNRALARALVTIATIIPIALGSLLIQQNIKVREVQARNRTIEEKSYSLGLLNAQQHLRSREMPLARARLMECSEPLRGLEWDYLNYAIDGGSEFLVRDSAAITALAQSASGSIIATGSDSGELRLLVDGLTFQVTSLKASAVQVLEFHPKQELLVSAVSLLGDRDPSWAVQLWNARDASLVRSFLEHGARVNCLALDAEGRYLASGDQLGMLLIEDLETGELLARVSTNGDAITALAFDAPGENLYLGTATGGVRRWNLSCGEFEGQPQHFGLAIADSQLSADGEHLYLACGTQILDLDPADLSSRPSLSGHARPVSALALDRRAERLASAATDGSLWIWDLANRTKLFELAGHPVEVNDLLFDANDEHILSASEDGSARLWIPALQAELSLGSHGDWVEGLGFDASGTRLASAGRDRSLRLWDTASGELLQRIELEGRAYGLAWIGSHELAYGIDDAHLRVIDLAQASASRLRLGSGTSLVALAANRERGLLLGRYNDNTLHLWHADEELPFLTFVAEEAFNYSQAIHPSGASFAIGLDDGRVSLHSSESGRVLGSLKHDDAAIVSIAYSPDGRWLAAGDVKNRIQLWDLAHGKLLQSMTGHESQVTSLAFTSDGSRLVSGSVDRTLRIWEPKLGVLLLTLAGHQSAITALAIDPAGTQLASASKDGVVRLWRAGVPAGSAR